MTLARANYWVFDPTKRRSRCRPAARKRGRGQRSGRVAGLAGLILVCLGLLASVTSGSDLTFSAQAQRAFWEALKRYEGEPRNAEAAWQFARACFDRAEFATNSTERAEIAELGIAACQQLIAREPKSAPAHYYLGMNLGQLAQT